MKLKKKLLALILAVAMAVPMMAQTVFADTQDDKFTVIFKTNADVEMGRKDYTVGNASNALPAVGELKTLFPDFIERAKQKGGVAVNNPIWYEDSDFTTPADMPDGEAGNEYTVYCSFVGVYYNGFYKTDITGSYADIKEALHPALGVNWSASPSRSDAYKAVFEKKVDGGWSVVDDSYYTDFGGNTWENLISFRSVEDSGEYRLKYMVCTATDNNGEVLYYDYVYDDDNTICNVEITPVELTISGVSAVDRDNDGTNKVELTGGTLEGVLFDDDVDFELGEGTVENSKGGEGLAVVTDIKLTGDKSVNYVIKQPEGITVNITPAPVESGNNKGSSHSLEEKKKDKKDDVKAGNIDDGLKNNDVTSKNDGQKAVTEKQDFDDVKTTDWFYSDVTKVTENGLMNGISESKFNPNDYITRAMAAVIIHNAENNPAPDGVAAFLDVTSDKYYADSVAWTSEKRIVNGYSEEIFAPDELITREQMAMILYNYAQMKGREINSFAELDTFSDGTAVSDFAKEALSWAVGNGYVTGKGNRMLDPKGTATRAEMASIIVRFLDI